MKKIKTNILIIEDEKSAFERIKNQFSDTSKYSIMNDELNLENSVFITALYSVHEAIHNEILLGKLKALGKIDLIILDYTLHPTVEKLNGLDTLHILQKNHSLFLTANFILLTQIDTSKFNEILGTKLIEYFKFQKWLPFFKDKSSNIEINQDQFTKAVEYLTMKKHFEVFIGYASEDLPLLSLFRSNLDARPKETGDITLNYNSDRKLLVGKNWERGIQGMLEKSDIGIFLISNHFFKKESFGKEIELKYFQNEINRKIIFPVVISELTSHLNSTSSQYFQPAKADVDLDFPCNPTLSEINVKINRVGDKEFYLNKYFNHFDDKLMEAIKNKWA